MITENRGFFIINSRSKYIEVYKTYIAAPDLTTKSITTTAKKHGLAVRDCATIVNKFTNQLIGEILSDLEKCFLRIQEYKPKKPTKTQIIKEFNKEAIKGGFKPLPLRKKSLKEKLKDFEKSLNEIKEKDHNKIHI